MEVNSTRTAWLIMLSSAAILAITMGARQSVGLFVSPIDTTTGLGIVSISFALAVGQFIWGLAQPIFGAIADKRGSYGVIVFGTFLLAGGLALTPFANSEWSLVLTMGILSAAGAGAGSFSILIGATSQRIPAERRAFAGGFINAGGSLGQFIFAPLLQAVISGFGWVTAMFTMAATTLLTIPLASLLCGKRAPAMAVAAEQPAGGVDTAITVGDAGSKLSVPACRFFYLRFSHCLSGDSFAGRSCVMRAFCQCIGSLVSYNRLV